jgi:carbonic anhydrase
VSRLLDECFDANRRWAADQTARDPGYFKRLEALQNPDLLWIGCSDSRLPPNEIIGRAPGEVFVHRNVGNVVATNDWNLSAVLEFSINHLGIPDVVICGHYGCGGIAALDEDDANDKYIPVWLINAYKAKERVDEKLRGLHVELPAEQRSRLIVEENVRLQLEHLREYPFVRHAMQARKLRIHGWVYDMGTGAIRVLSGE